MRYLLTTILAFSICLVATAKPTRANLGGDPPKDTKGSLPYDAEVEWIRSGNGNMYIDTGLSVTEFILSTKTETTNVGVNELYMFGSGDTTTGVVLARIGRYATTEKRVYCNGVKIAGISKEPSEFVNVSVSVNSYAQTLLLFNARLPDGSVRTSNGGFTCYSFSLKGKNNEVLCSYIPVRFTNENGQSEGAMYDRVSGQLFRNQGSGSFVIGPDKN